MSAKAILLAHYDKLCESRTASESKLAEYKEARQAIAGVFESFFNTLAEDTGIAIGSIIELFKNSKVVVFFKAIGWSLKKLWNILKEGHRVYGELLKAVAEYTKQFKIVKWGEAELMKFDEWMKEHPKWKKLIGVAVAALLVYIMFYGGGTSTGHLDFDFGIDDIIAAIKGSYTLADIFASHGGIIMMLTLVTGAIGFGGFPWPTATSFQFAGSVLYTLANLIGKKLHIVKEKPQVAVAHRLAMEEAIAYEFTRNLRKKS